MTDNWFLLTCRRGLSILGAGCQSTARTAGLGFVCGTRSERKLTRQSSQLWCSSGRQWTIWWSTVVEHTIRTRKSSLSISCRFSEYRRCLSEHYHLNIRSTISTWYDRQRACCRFPRLTIGPEPAVSVLYHFYTTFIYLNSRRESRVPVSFGRRRRGVCSV